MNPLQKKRPELLLTAAALLIAAISLTAVGVRQMHSAQEETTQADQALQAVNPFEQAQASAVQNSDEAFEHGVYIVGYTQAADIQTQPPAETTAAAPQTQALPSSPVNINTASQAQLEVLPGIGPVKAQAILARRAAVGAFTNASQLLEIKGIGQTTLEELLPYITW